MVMSDEEKLKTAYHESGHAIVGRSLEEHDPVYKVTIIPRGRAFWALLCFTLKKISTVIVIKVSWTESADYMEAE